MDNGMDGPWTMPSAPCGLSVGVVAVLALQAAHRSPTLRPQVRASRAQPCTRYYLGIHNFHSEKPSTPCMGARQRANDSSAPAGSGRKE